MNEEWRPTNFSAPVLLSPGEVIINMGIIDVK